MPKPPKPSMPPMPGPPTPQAGGLHDTISGSKMASPPTAPPPIVGSGLHDSISKPSTSPPEASPPPIVDGGLHDSIARPSNSPLIVGELNSPDSTVLSTPSTAAVPQQTDCDGASIDEGDETSDFIDKNQADIPSQVSEDPKRLVMPKDIDACRDVLNDAYGLVPQTWRFIGRVAEFPIVRENGKAGDLAELWPFLKRALIDEGFAVHRERNGMFSALIGPEYTYRCGIGRGIVRIEIPSQSDLFGVENALMSAMTPLIEVAASRRLKILAYGVHPVTPPSGSQLTHLYHLHSLLKILGDPWAARSTVARDNILISCGRNELLDQINLGRLLEPLFYALFSNSAIAAGGDSYHSNASQLSMDKIDLEGGRGIQVDGLYDTESDWLTDVLSWRQLLKSDEEGWLEPSDTFFCEDMPEQPELKERLQQHFEVSWGPVRPLLNSASLEWRSACQQPWAERMTVSAFCLGLMENSTEFYDFLDNFLPPPPQRLHIGLTMAQIIEKEIEEAQNPWPLFKKWRRKALAYGLNSEEAFTGVLEGALAVAENGLISRGMGEEKFLGPLFERIRSRADHAEPVRRAFARFGLSDFLSRVEIRL